MMSDQVNMKNSNLSPGQIGHEIRKIYASTGFYGVFEILFTNSFMLLYFSALHISSERILFYLSMPMLIRIITLMLFAEKTERIGKVRAGVWGLSLSTVSTLLLVAAGFIAKPLVEPVVFTAVLFYGVGYGIYLNSWFPIISTIVPADRRGRFFGVMRFIYQSVGIVFTFIVGLTLGKDASIGIFQFYLVICFSFRIIGIVIYSRIPELERQFYSGRTILSSIFHVVGKKGYLPFCSYVFLLSLFTGSCQSIFSLLAKDTLGMHGGHVIFLGNLVTFGALFGYFCGGLMVDRLGTKSVFLFCHFSFASSMVLFLSRDFLPLPLMLVIGSLSLAFGIVQAASEIAISSEMMAVSPPDNKPMATAVCYSLISLGLSLSG
ncbi:MAG: MFS transporter, partial [Lentisphaerota bacterium]